MVKNQQKIPRRKKKFGHSCSSNLKFMFSIFESSTVRSENLRTMSGIRKKVVRSKSSFGLSEQNLNLGSPYCAKKPFSYVDLPQSRKYLVQSICLASSTS